MSKVVFYSTEPEWPYFDYKRVSKNVKYRSL